MILRSLQVFRELKVGQRYLLSWSRMRCSRIPTSIGKGNVSETARQYCVTKGRVVPSRKSCSVEEKLFRREKVVPSRKSFSAEEFLIGKVVGRGKVSVRRL